MKKERNYIMAGIDPKKTTFTGKNYDVRLPGGDIQYSKQHKEDMALFKQIDEAGNGDWHISRNEYYEYLNKKLKALEAQDEEYKKFDKAKFIEDEMKKFDNYSKRQNLNIDEFMLMRDEERTDEITYNDDGKVALSKHSRREDIEQYVARFDDDKDGVIDAEEMEKFKEATIYTDLTPSCIESVACDIEKKSKISRENCYYTVAIDICENPKEGLNRKQYLNFVENNGKVRWYSNDSAKEILNAPRWSDGKSFTEAEELERYFDEEIKFKQLDENGDGYISQEEYEKRPEE